MLDMSEGDMADFNPQVHILHLSGSDDASLLKQPKNMQGKRDKNKEFNLGQDLSEEPLAESDGALEVPKK